MMKKNMIGKFIKNIFTSSKTKKLLFVFIFLFVCYFAFSLGADCLADDVAVAVQNKMTTFSTIASEVIKCVYVLLWPLIFVCGIALDNSLVYGTWLHLDAPLWALWNVMKNIANFALGGIVLFSILKNILSVVGKPNDNWKPMKIIKNTLIAGILIQMSWFLVAAVIDLSTVLTYAIGGLPMTVLGEDPNYSDRPVMSLSINVGSDARGMDYVIYYTYGDHKISDCNIYKNLATSGSFIVGPEIAYLWDSHNDTGFYLDTGYCAFGGWPYKYKHLLSGDGGIYPDIYQMSYTGVKNDMYLDSLDQNMRSSGVDMQALINDCAVIPLDESKIPESCSGYGALPFNGDHEFFRGPNSENTILYTIDNLIEESKGFVGPLITIYSSLLDIQSFVEDGTDSYVETFISLLFKLFFAIILVAPLAGLAVVLIVRVGVLWIVIAAAPVLILLWVFGDALGGLKDLVKDSFSVGNIVKLVFAPVIITFAISLSLIFINAISSINRDNVQREDVFNALGIETSPDNYNSYSILGLIDIELNTTLIGKGKNDFAYFITLLFSTAIIRFFLMAALKMCGKIGDKVGGFMSENFEKMVTNAPIIPLPSGGAVGLATLKKAPDLVTEDIVSQFTTKSTQNMKESFPWLYSDTKGSIAQQIVNNVKSNKNITSLTSAQVNILRPIFGTANEAELLNIIRNTDSGEIKSMIDNYDKYESKQSGYREVISDAGLNTSALTSDQLEVAVQYHDTWKNWAETNKGQMVYTSDGIYMVDAVRMSNGRLVYKTVTTGEYEKKIFKSTILDLENAPTSTADIDSYLKQLKEYYEKYKNVKDKTIDQEKNSSEYNEQQTLKNLFTEKYVEKLKQLRPSTFN